MKQTNAQNDVDNNWDGYTLEELKYQRAISLVKLEMQKAVLSSKYSSSIKDRSVMGGSSTLFGKKMNIFNYAVIGFKVFKGTLNLWNKWKRK